MSEGARQTFIRDISHRRMEGEFARCIKLSRLFLQFPRFSAAGLSQNDDTLMFQELGPSDLSNEAALEWTEILCAALLVAPFLEFPIQRCVRHVLLGTVERRLISNVA